MGELTTLKSGFPGRPVSVDSGKARPLPTRLPPQ